MYIAIKLEGMNHWLWFDTDKVTEEGGMFVGKSGWGKNGAHTDISVSSSVIKGRMESDTLQYL